MEPTPQDQAMPEEQKERQQFITFTVQKREYGIDIMSIREIKGWTATTTLPNSPPYVRGVINLRGTVVPIIDLRARFSMGDTEATKNHVVMIVNIGARLMGILVDGVSDILTIDQDEIRPVPEVEGSNHGEIIRGLVSLENRMVAILILEKLFDKNIDFIQQPDFSNDDESFNTSEFKSTTLDLTFDDQKDQTLENNAAHS